MDAREVTSFPGAPNAEPLRSRSAWLSTFLRWRQHRWLAVSVARPLQFNFAGLNALPEFAQIVAELIHPVEKWRHQLPDDLPGSGCMSIIH